MDQWTSRQITIVGVVSLIMLLMGVGIAASWSTDISRHRAAIESSEQASCADADQDCAQKDLPAQVRAATAAELVADLTFFQVVLTFVSVGIGGATMFAAILAANYAKEAAIHTANGAESAQVSAHSGRAWILSSGMNVNAFSNGVIDGKYVANGLMIETVMKNSGLSPALEVRFQRSFRLVPFDDPSFEVWLEGSEMGGAICGPGVEFFCPLDRTQ